MKLILGDNQFFGVNHADLKKAEKIKEEFSSEKEISAFICESLDLGLHGFMINSNDLGIDVIKEFDFNSRETDVHYSIPYPHKYAGIVNDSGVIALLNLVVRNLRVPDFFHCVKFLFSFNAMYLMPIVVKLEIPKGLPKGSTVYLQNVVTDLTMGLKNGEKIISYYIKTITNMGFKPGLITLNPGYVYKRMKATHAHEKLTLCFNMNMSGFNLFPSKNQVEDCIEDVQTNTKWDLMAMSIFSSGAKGVSIEESINYIKSKNVDFVVFGSSKLKNIASNISRFK